MMKVISLKICPFVQRVTALLAAKSIAYDVEYIDFDNLPEWFLSVSPNAQVPLLITESGSVLFESDAIAEYIDDAYPPLEPDLSAESRAQDRAWATQATQHYLKQCYSFRSPTAEAFAQRNQVMQALYSKMEQQLTQTPFYKGEALSNVDIAWFPLLHRAALIEQYGHYDTLSAFPQLKVWQQALLNTDLAKASVADDFEQIFTRFYLSHETYLGQSCDCTFEALPVCGSKSCC